MKEEVKIFKIDETFSNSDELYNFIIKNTDKVGELMGVQIQALKNRLFCLTGKEKITKKNIVLIASENEYPQSLADLILLAGAVDADIIVFFLGKATVTYMESFNWLQRISNDNTQFIIGEVSYNN